MTYNIHHAMGIDKRLDISRIAKVITQSDADIIGLNEVDKHFSKRSHYRDQITLLADQLNMYKAFSPSLTIKSNYKRNVRQYGNALLSRYPIANEKNYLFNKGPRLSEGRSLLNTIIQINNKYVQVMVTHLSLNPFLHRKQTDFIVNQLYNSPYPNIVMGDWNMRPGSRQWAKMINVSQDVWHVAGDGEGFTYPSVRPRSRLDYLFVSSNLNVIETEVGTKMPEASDHLPLNATLFLI